MPLFQTGATYKNQSELSRKDRLLGEGLDDLASQSAVLRKYAFVGLTGPPAPPSTPAKLQVSVNSSGVFSATVVHNAPELGTQYVLQYSTTPNFQPATTTSELLTHTPSIPTTWQKNLPAGTGLYFRTAAKFPASKLGSWVYAGGGAITGVAAPSPVRQVLSSGGGGGGGSSLALEVNGTPNADQSLLNLFNGSNVTITDAGGGKVIIAAAGVGSGVGHFFGAGFMGPFYGGVINNSSDLGVNANEVNVFSFVLTQPWTLTTASYQWFQNVGGGGTFGFGFYNNSGAALLRTSFSINAGGPSAVPPNSALTNTFSPVTLPSGVVLYFGQSTSHTGLVQVAFGLNTVAGEAAELMFYLMNSAGETQAAVAANAMSGGVMPATLGALTPLSSSAQSGIGIAAVKWTP